MSEAGKMARLVADVHQLRRGQCWCTVCGFKRAVNSAESLCHGWPKCCGYTMTIDSPEERAALKSQEK